MHNFVLDMVDYNNIQGKKLELQLEKIDVKCYNNIDQLIVGRSNEYLFPYSLTKGTQNHI